MSSKQPFNICAQVYSELQIEESAQDIISNVITSGKVFSNFHPLI